MSDYNFRYAVCSALPCPCLLLTRTMYDKKKIFFIYIWILGLYFGLGLLLACCFKHVQ